MVTRRTKANALRALSMDAVQQAKSGHPGMPMGMADIAEVLWSDFLRYNPSNPEWTDRDRFVLSNGHGSMLLYALLYLTGYALPLKNLGIFANCTLQHRGTQNLVVRLGLRQPRDLWDRVLLMPLVWHLAKRYFRPNLIARATPLLTTGHMFFSEMVA